MKDAETNWANQTESAEERARRFNVEINQRRKGNAKDSLCEWPRCLNSGFAEIEIKRVGDYFGTWITLCKEHNDDEKALIVYDNGHE